MVAFNVGVISEVMGELQRAAGATERLVELLDTESEIKAPENPVALPATHAGAIEFESVHFRYPSRPDTLSLSNVSLKIEPGQSVALVGPSGAGKTTIMQLLLRFYDVESGCIKVDGVDIAKADPEEVRNRMALVPQDPMIFSANAWENIRYGRPDASDEDVRAAADAAQATEFLDKLPDGFDSFLGEKGTRLSGGQRQRLSIARALLRDPSILLLDEATSALDAENERIVQQALDRLMVGRTTLIIAHRLATVVNADRICVIDRGEIKAIGTHAELIKTNELYSKLAKLQFSADA
jgi:ATP-binding cassette subfamily B protein